MRTTARDRSGHGQLHDRLGRARGARSRMPVMRPSCITATRSLSATISSRSLLIITTAAPSSASARISRWISALAPTSTPCVGSSKTMTRGRQRQPLAEHDLLLVAAAERRDRASRSTRAFTVSAVAISPGGLGLGAAPRPDPQRAYERERRQRDVLAHAHRGDHAAPAPVLRHQADALADGVARRSDRQRLAVEQRRRPARRGPMPQIASASSERPAPIRPAMPSTSPRWTVSETSAPG